ncbi:ROK family transcriptional regulator [Actinoplanes derwentensis]|uniref:Sugar kinase of the NBD/HSP70 family, may contain an N-terminal HTH domain n=1 Tax=Actinoplanes derwentensis TaxID=113562 RepID=A0A1H2CY97_9ACTN|nr:ROK family transcriptional regulator [Actinoplanes derwentensis]GID82949.1 xylose repressor [Actinoplanes derwentensis]SDT75540.1 Sugar kinase of the NBD/HSP70 family, may contain an N-terminal HTH domain [Actinoplanes derwentensis]
MTTRSTELLRAVHRNPGITRADAARLLGIGTGAATELVTRLSQAALLTQAPAAPSGTRGRPTTVLLPHPGGPLVLALAITHEAWRLDVVELGGTTAAALSERHENAPWAQVRGAVAAAVKQFHARYGPRLRAIGISVPGPVTRGPRLDAINSDWRGIDLTELWPGAELLVAGNDATLAATAEHLRGAAAGASVALHLRIESGLGGALVEDGRPAIGARNTAGEFGHMPFGDPEITCACGAHGCWGTTIDGTAMARLLGDPPPRDPVTYARHVIATATRAPAGLRPPSPAASSYSSGESGPAIDPEAARRAVETVGTALGRGIAGLVNALDPDLVTLGGLGPDLLTAVPEAITTAYLDGLMTIHREVPPPVLPASLPDDEGPITGAAEQAWAALLPRLT